MTSTPAKQHKIAMTDIVSSNVTFLKETFDLVCPTKDIRNPHFSCGVVVDVLHTKPQHLNAHFKRDIFYQLLQKKKKSSRFTEESDGFFKPLYLWH
jgi:hypothetical protein